MKVAKILFSLALVLFLSGCNKDDDIETLGSGAFTVIDGDNEQTYDTNFGLLLTLSSSSTFAGLTLNSQDVAQSIVVSGLNSVQLAGAFLEDGVLSSGDFDVSSAIIFIGFSSDLTGGSSFEERYDAEGTVTITRLSSNEFDVTYVLEGTEGEQITGSYSGRVVAETF